MGRGSTHSVLFSLTSRYQPLDSQLRPKRHLSSVLEYICYQDSAEVQVEAIRVATELVQVGWGNSGVDVRSISLNVTRVPLIK